MRDVYKQLDSGVRFEWGPQGAEQVGSADGVTIVVDVLSFTTAVSVSVGRGIDVMPYRWRDESAAVFASEHEATLAVGRSEATADHPWCLSPAALLEAPPVPKLVLPSPNGSHISFSAPGIVIAGCLRNASAVAQWCIDNEYGTVDRPITVIASGERWPNVDTLRPAIEDLLGAGAILTPLRDEGLLLSPETLAGTNLFTHTMDLTELLVTSASGRELFEDGFGEDVEVAAVLDDDTTVPVLHHGAFSAAK